MYYQTPHREANSIMQENGNNINDVSNGSSTNSSCSMDSIWVNIKDKVNSLIFLIRDKRVN